MITGEPNPVEKSPGGPVIGGAVNMNGVLKISITKTGEETALSGIMRLVVEAQASRSHAQDLADRAAFYLTIIAAIGGEVTFFGWLLVGGSVAFALERMVTVFVIACPMALGLAVPLVVAVSTSLGARQGLLVRRRAALESAHNVDVVLFDKTGTLTTGAHGVTDLWPMEGYDENALLYLAASAEIPSEHSLGKAVVAKARETHIVLSDARTSGRCPERALRATCGESRSPSGVCSFWRKRRSPSRRPSRRISRRPRAKGRPCSSCLTAVWWREPWRWAMSPAGNRRRPCARSRKWASASQ